MSELIRTDGKVPGKRKYIDDETGLTFLSATAWIKEALPTPQPLIDWQIDKGRWFVYKTLFESSTYGTIVHDLCEMFLIKKALKLEFIKEYVNTELTKFGLGRFYSEWMWEIQNDLICFRQMCIDKNLKMIKTEERLKLQLTNTGGLAGTYDILCELDSRGGRRLAMVDLKTTRKGFWDSNKTQLHLYRKMFCEENDAFDEKDILLFNWHPKDFKKETPTYNMTEQTSKEEALILDHMLEIAKIKEPWLSNKMFKTFDVLTFENADYIRKSISEVVLGGEGVAPKAATSWLHS